MMYYCERDVDVLIAGLNGFRTILQKQSQIEALNFVSISSIAYNNALKNFVNTSDIKIHTIESEHIYEVFEKSMFGGSCQVFDHYGKIGEDNVKFLMSLDENNLYGWAMTKPLPYGDFQLIKDKITCGEIL
eukprot:TRINITY_DN6185_c0_g1_i1.p1 TRINITY_DN6185_c0_g1~~TRINITY_DN6185_c0_g1_i1.p1  ORF type:complete len:131 (-),score=33.80 TRINITY_DN6185_c0_g1_i1:33-425(-)